MPELCASMPDVRICDLLAGAKRPLLSFEFFPPKDETAMSPLRIAAAQLLALRPDFVTCTYGAGGSTRQRTLAICSMLRDMGYDAVMPHLTCVGSSREELIATADEIYARGFRNIMTLRGDPPKGDTTFKPAPDGLANASELVTLLKSRHADFCCGVAGYPEMHPEAVSLEVDLAHLKRKADAGGGFVTTQLFFDNRVYFDFVKRCRAAGIKVPIVPGLLPAISLKQVQRMCAMCRATLPDGLARAMEAAGNEGEAAEYVGIRWAERQIMELIAGGAPGVHLYILNRSKAVLSGELIHFFQHAGR